VEKREGGAVTSGVKFVSGLLVIALVTGCSSSADKNANTEAVTALQRMSSAVQDVEIVVSAGVTKEEYSKRLADALLKFGNPEDSCKLAVAKFSNLDQKALAAQACQHLSKSMAAFVYAK
jgi:hypothetical protein